ncbi:hypothetical protein GcM1_195008 [Golovinomyces cichoracearum]|uniref:Uncharacterized protein n=1 Tax=Golovinomyces cichoracearum TaxID=62708 RepID=A0A420J0D1_9PEZI|nr:hypothetical protein GcM1_195008 [Golovinomyces cichoracearum]
MVKSSIPLAIFFSLLLLIIIFSCIGLLVHTQLRARRLGLPRPSLSSYNPFAKKHEYYGPSPAHGGLVGWARDKVRIFKNRNIHSSTGLSAEPFRNNDGRRMKNHKFNPLDPDEAWDTRDEEEPNSYPFYQEQEFKYHHLTDVPPEQNYSRDQEPS